MLGALALVFLLLASCGVEKGSPATDLVAEVGDQEVRRGELEAYLREHGGDPAEAPMDPRVRSRLLDNFLDEMLLQRYARERGFLPAVDEPTDSRAMIDFLIRTTPGAGVADEAVLAYYEANQERYRQPEQVHLRQILVHDQEAAQQAQAALRRGQSFEEVAARFSQGPMAEKGGDQGRLGKEDLPAEFAEMIFGLGEGKVSGIVKADYGFHIFQVVSLHPAEVTSLDQATPGIRRELALRIADEQVLRFLDEARERYTVNIYENNLPFEYRGVYGT